MFVLESGYESSPQDLVVKQACHYVFYALVVVLFSSELQTFGDCRKEINTHLH